MLSEAWGGASVDGRDVHGFWVVVWARLVGGFGPLGCLAGRATTRRTLTLALSHRGRGDCGIVFRNIAASFGNACGYRFEFHLLFQRRRRRQPVARRTAVSSSAARFHSVLPSSLAL